MMKDIYKDSNNEEYYHILGLNKNCTPQEIKKQYHKMALKFHPDKLNSKEGQSQYHFNRVQEAYSTLSDQQKKKVYDKYGKKGLEFQDDCKKMSQSNHFNEFFKNDYLGSSLSGFDVLKNILHDEDDEIDYSKISGYISTTSDRLRSFIDDNILSTDSEDEKSDFVAQYRPTFLDKTFVNSNDDLRQRISENNAKHGFKKEKSFDSTQNFSFEYFMNALKGNKDQTLCREENEESQCFERIFESNSIRPSRIKQKYTFGLNEEEIYVPDISISAKSKRISKTKIN